MLNNQKARRIAIGSALGGALVLGGAWLVLQDSFFRMAVHPPGSFASTPAPPVPDYSRAESWALRPATAPPGAWETPWGVDVFFIHPTTAYAGDDWNAGIDDSVSSERLTKRILPNHAGPFLKAGPVYAPRYRQASLWSEMNVGGGGDGAFRLAYNDVLAAFDSYVENDNRSRGIILAGVGQGGLYVQRLLLDRFQSEPLKERFAAAYVIDAAVPADFPGAVIAQKTCESADEIKCIVAWRSVVGGEDGRRVRETSPVWAADGSIADSKDRPLVCVNPLTWSTRDNLALKSDHRGGARVRGPDDLDPRIVAGAVSTRCRGGLLEVERPSSPDLQSGGWGARYKTPNYNLFYADLVANVAGRARVASAWLDQHGRKPAAPLPPATTLEDEGIFRPDGEARPAPLSGQ